MAWWGKLLGGTFGFMLGGPLGALIGAGLGHGFDSGLKQAPGGWSGKIEFDRHERTQTAFFTATFSVMGHIAKADGRVSQDEIELAGAMMDQMNLSRPLRDVAKRLFNEGKAPGFPLNDVLDQFRIECHRSQNLLRIFIEIQLNAAYADGNVHSAERKLLEHVTERLGLSPSELNHLEAMFRAGRRTAEDTGPSLEESYAVLGVSSSANDDDIKRAYRRLMSQHHPDKLVARGLPEEMMKLATEKTQEIKAAYEQIKQARAQA